MARGLALLVGLKEVDPYHYNGFDGKDGCWGCEVDVQRMETLLKGKGFVTKSILTKKATRNAIIEALVSAVAQMQAGDTFVFYYSGHGGRRLDHGLDESDGYDETILAFDGELIDDRLFQVWQQFKPGVRIISVADSCHSGTLYALVGDSMAGPGIVAAKAMVPLTERAASKMQATMVHMAAASDSTLAKGDADGGRFTKALLQILGGAPLHTTYLGLHEHLRAALHGIQQPEITGFGPASDALLATTPFQL